MKVLNSMWLTGLFLAVFSGGMWIVVELGQAQTGSLDSVSEVPRKLDAEEQTNVSLFRRASPSVVNICTKAAVARRSGAVTLDLEAIPTGAGSGFLWDAQGHVVTNFHVIREADAAQVTLGDGTVWDAELVGTAPEYDVAVLRIQAPAAELTPLAIGRSRDLAVGQKVYAIGNPFGLDHTLTTGIISGLGRQIESLSGQPIEDVIQTDAAINPGNSGGPLLDSQGQLIGMNTAIFSPSGASAGVGFAIPVDTVRGVVPDLIRFGKLERPGLGVTLAPADISQRIGIEGVLILRVAEGSPAAESRLQPTRYDERGNLQLGDIVVNIDGERIRESTELVNRLRNRKVGDVVTLGIRRGGEIIRVEVRLRAI